METAERNDWPRQSSDDDAVVAAIGAARTAQAKWSARNLTARLAVIRALRHALARDWNELAQSVGTATRRSSAETLMAEILPLAEACRFLEHEAPHALRPRRFGRRRRPLWLPGHRAEIRREPVGIVLVVAPWNYPLLLPGVQIVQALAAGNAVLVKPAPGASAPLRLLGELLAGAGLPASLCQVLAEDPSVVHAAIAAGADHVILTGSAETGRVIARTAAAGLVPTTLELSGHDPMFVLPGADLDLVTRALHYGLRLNGSATCVAPRRVFVGHDQADALERRLAAIMPTLPAVPLPPAQLSAIGSLVANALASGARRVGVSRASPPGHMAPVVLADLHDDDCLLRESVFAPVLALIAVDDIDEALRRAQCCPYALGASVFGPEATARDVAARVNAGSVTINDVIVPTADPRLPFAGRQASGHGATRGIEGLLALTHIKVISVRDGRARRHYQPLAADDAPLAGAALNLLHGGRLVERLAAAGALILAVFRLNRQK